MADFLDARLPERFWDKVVPEPNSGCWLWTGASVSNGYGQIKRAGTRTQVLAHRMAYETLVGPIAADLEIDHRVCRIPCCVNPTHLEPVTSAENARRAVRVRPVKTHCKHGHEFTPENTYKGKAGRNCIACRRAIDRARDATHERAWSARRKA
jgi:hypothetical protein